LKTKNHYLKWLIVAELLKKFKIQLQMFSYPRPRLWVEEQGGQVIGKVPSLNEL